ncbi:MAG: signal peptidase II [Planctomycetes bacterium]|nr:signal peptidase II [Planctomycetota bacterium]
MPTETDSNKPLPKRAGNDMKAIIIALVVMFCALGSDLFVKNLAFHNVAGYVVNPNDIPHHDAVNLIPSILSLKLVANRGAVFGIGQGQRWMFIILGIIAIVVIVTTFLKSAAHRRWMHIALAMILAGALGNLYDRVMIGAVRDMLWLFPGVKLPFGWHWPRGNDELYPWVFNIADMALLFGLGIILIVLWRDDSKSAKKKALDVEG